MHFFSFNTVKSLNELNVHNNTGKKISGEQAKRVVKLLERSVDCSSQRKLLELFHVHDLGLSFYRPFRVYYVKTSKTSHIDFDLLGRAI